MCSNSVTECIECYMDELIDCFEDFVKKSLIIISVGIAAVVGMLLYILLKVLSDRPPPSNVIAEDASSAHNQIRNLASEDHQTQKRIRKLQQKSLSQESDTSLRKASSCKITTDVNTVSSYTNIPPLTKKLSFDEKVLRDVGLSSCSKLHCCERTNSHSSSYIPRKVPVSDVSPTKRKSAHAIQPTSSKRVIPSLPICPKSVPKKGSCCSICCDDEPLS